MEVSVGRRKFRRADEIFVSEGPAFPSETSGAGWRDKCFSVDRELNPYDGPFVKWVHEVATTFHRPTERMPKYATLAVEVAAERNGPAPNQYLLRVSLVNEGINPIVLTDPTDRPGDRWRSSTERCELALIFGASAAV
jgi:hypothetical protein